MKREKSLIFALLFMFVVPSILAQNTQSYGTENVIGSISGEQDAGESYELYKSSLDSFLGYLSGWKYVGWRDRRVTYSESQLYEKCLAEAKRQYAKYYPELYLKDFYCTMEELELSDEEYYSQEVGSGNKFKKKERKKRVYKYSAIVIAIQ